MSDRLAEIQARERATTPGPWEAEQDSCKGKRVLYIRSEATHPSVIAALRTKDSGICLGQQEADFLFIAHSRQDILYLLERIMELESG